MHNQVSRTTALPVSATETPVFPGDRLTCGVALITLFVIVALWLNKAGHAPWSDSGGYEQMLRGFLQTGKVDYMHWSQPTFLGILPIAAPWGMLFGTTTSSLQWLGVAYGAALVVGLYVLLTSWVCPTVAALLCACLLCFSEFVLVVPTFMTDMPYGAYLVWFLVAHQRLTALYETQSPVRRPHALWVAWGGLFLLVSLTRSFTLVLVPLFAWQAFRLQRENAFITNGQSDMTRTCLLIAVSMSVVCPVLVKLLTQNGFSPMQLTALPEIVGHHDWKRFELRTLGTALAQATLIALPALALSAQSQWKRLSPQETALAVLGLFLTVWFTRKGIVTPLIALPRMAKFVAILQIALSPIGFVLAWRVLRRSAVRANLGITPVLLTIFAAHFLVLPIMQHPLLRHVLPAYLVLLPLIAIAGVKENRAAFALAACGVLLIGGSNIISAHAARRVADVEWRFADDLRRSGVPLDQIDGGWNWFCEYHLNPGQPDSEGYIPRYKRLQDTARYLVSDDRSISLDACVVREEAVSGPSGETRVRLFDRALVPPKKTSSLSNRKMP